MSSLAVSGFRKLLRSAQVAFKADSFALSQAKAQLKEEFRKNSNVKDPSELQQLIRGIEEVDEMLRFNIVQGKRNEKGNFAASLDKPEHQITLESGKDDPHGVDIAPIDQSILGNPESIKITKTKGAKGSKCSK